MIAARTPRLFDAEDFADRVAGAIQARGLTLRQVADESGVSPASLSRIQGGWLDVSHENVLRLEAWMADQTQVA
ncbi:helix-turn-helix domain-containing protein [Phenylobacterium sp.]|uniref:helix-turn-helix domain-containing protein n=1 Tax=Phenylobacterium sp. TaxID=1871053 RepID=UPI002FCBD31B